MEQYAELCGKNLDWALKATEVSTDDFVKGWAKTTSEELGVPETDITDLFTASKPHNTDWRVRENWKYSSSIGLSGTPSAFINGVQLENYPTSKDEWK